MPRALQQVRRARERCLRGVVSPIARRDSVGLVESLDVRDDLGDDPTKPVADRNHAGTIVFRRFDVQQVVDLPVRQVSFEDVQGGQ